MFSSKYSLLVIPSFDHSVLKSIRVGAVRYLKWHNFSNSYNTTKYWTSIWCFMKLSTAVQNTEFITILRPEVLCKLSNMTISTCCWNLFQICKDRSGKKVMKQKVPIYIHFISFRDCLYQVINRSAKIFFNIILNTNIMAHLDSHKLQMKGVNSICSL